MATLVRVGKTTRRSRRGIRGNLPQTRRTKYLGLPVRIPSTRDSLEYNMIIPQNRRLIKACVVRATCRSPPGGSARMPWVHPRSKGGLQS